MQHLTNLKTNKIYYQITSWTHCFVQEDTILANMICTKKSSKLTDCYLKCWHVSIPCEWQIMSHPITCYLKLYHNKSQHLLLVLQKSISFFFCSCVDPGYTITKRRPVIRNYASTQDSLTSQTAIQCNSVWMQPGSTFLFRFIQVLI